jgi:hypothetical protein
MALASNRTTSFINFFVSWRLALTPTVSRWLEAVIFIIIIVRAGIAGQVAIFVFTCHSGLR